MVLWTTCTLSAESLGCPNNLKLKVSYVALKSSYPRYRWTSSSCWNVKVTWMMSSTSSTAVDYQILILAVLILLTSEVSYLSFKLPFIPSNDWSCYSVLYFHFCSLIVTWLSFFLSLEITTKSVVIMSSSWEWSLGESGLQNKSEISISINPYLGSYKYISIRKCHTKAYLDFSNSFPPSMMAMYYDASDQYFPDHSDQQFIHAYFSTNSLLHLTSLT